MEHGAIIAGPARPAPADGRSRRRAAPSPAAISHAAADQNVVDLAVGVPGRPGAPLDGPVPVGQEGPHRRPPQVHVTEQDRRRVSPRCAATLLECAVVAVRPVLKVRHVGADHRTGARRLPSGPPRWRPGAPGPARAGAGGPCATPSTTRSPRREDGDAPAPRLGRLEAGRRQLAGREGAHAARRRAPDCRPAGPGGASSAPWRRGGEGTRRPLARVHVTTW